MRKSLWYMAGLLAATGTPALAQSRERAPQLDELAACRGIADDTRRLACFDRAAGSFDEAEKHGDLVVASREQIRKDRREQFGLTSGEGPLVRRERAPEPPIENVESTLAGAVQSNYKWTFTLANGMRWRQTDNRSLIAPRAGSVVIVKRGSLGSYFIQIGRAPIMRAVRVR